MTTWTNTAEGTNGANVATSDTLPAGDTGWSTVSVVAGQTITYDNTFAAHGGTSHKHANTTGGGAYVAWTSAVVGTMTTGYARAYIYFSAVPTVATRIISFLSSTTLRGALRTDTTGHLVVANGAGTAMLTTTTVLTTGVWYRAEVKFVGVATTGGSAQLKLYPMDFGTAMEDITSASTFDTGGSFDAVRFGNSSGATSTTLWMDDYAVSDTGFVGAVAFSGQTAHPSSDVTTTGWVATGGTGSLASAIDEPTIDDTDYVTSPATPSASVLEEKFETFSIPTVKTSWSVDYRIRSANASSSTITAALYQGATLIASETRVGVPTSFTTYTLYLTNTQAATITDGTNLRLRLTATAS